MGQQQSPALVIRAGLCCAEDVAESKKGIVLLPRPRVVERSFSSMARFRRLARNYERLPETVAGLHMLAFSMLMVSRLLTLLFLRDQVHDTLQAIISSDFGIA